MEKEQLVLFMESEPRQSLNSFIDNAVKLRNKYKYDVVGNYKGKTIKVGETDDFKSVRSQYKQNIKSMVKIVV